MACMYLGEGGGGGVRESVSAMVECKSKCISVLRSFLLWPKTPCSNCVVWFKVMRITVHLISNTYFYTQKCWSLVPSQSYSCPKLLTDVWFLRYNHAGRALVALCVNWRIETCVRRAEDQRPLNKHSSPSHSYTHRDHGGLLSHSTPANPQGLCKTQLSMLDVTIARDHNTPLICT